MKRVCHLTSVHKATDTRIFYKMCASLAEAGYDTYLVAQGKSDEASGVHIVGVGDMPLSRRKRMTQWVKSVYRAALNVDAALYHIHDPELLPIGLKLKKRGFHVIFDSHEFYAEQIKNKAWLPLPLRALASEFYKFYEAYVCNRLDAVVAVCDYDGKNYFANRARKTVYIRNYPILDEMQAQGAKTEPKQNRSVGYVGGISSARGITKLILGTAMANGTLHLAGEFISSEYERELKSMPEWEHVRYYGFLDRKGIWSLLKSVNAGASTLLNVGQYHKLDTLPVKVYEYMNAGIPVILSNTRYNKAVMEKQHFGVCVDPEDARDIANALNRLFDFPDEAESMGQNARRAVLNEYNWNIEKQKLIALYEEILSEDKMEDVICNS